MPIDKGHIMINTSITANTLNMPRFSGYGAGTNPRLTGAQPGDTIFLQTTQDKGQTFEFEAIELVSIQGHGGERLHNKGVPGALINEDQVDKVTVKNKAGLKSSFLTGTYRNDSSEERVSINKIMAYSAQGMGEELTANHQAHQKLIKKSNQLSEFATNLLAKLDSAHELSNTVQIRKNNANLFEKIQ